MCVCARIIEADTCYRNVTKCVSINWRTKLCKIWAVGVKDASLKRVHFGKTLKTICGRWRVFAMSELRWKHLSFTSFTVHSARASSHATRQSGWYIFSYGERLNETCCQARSSREINTAGDGDLQAATREGKRPQKLWKLLQWMWSCQKNVELPSPQFLDWLTAHGGHTHSSVVWIYLLF